MMLLASHTHTEGQTSKFTLCCTAHTHSQAYTRIREALEAAESSRLERDAAVAKQKELEAELSALQHRLQGVRMVGLLCIHSIVLYIQIPLGSQLALGAALLWTSCVCVCCTNFSVLIRLGRIKLKRGFGT
jgi:hypothetical protein